MRSIHVHAGAVKRRHFFLHFLGEGVWEKRKRQNAQGGEGGVDKSVDKLDNKAKHTPQAHPESKP